MPDRRRDAYLAELDALLPMPAEQRAEVLEEIAGHLDDAVAERVERGAQPDRAELDALARLGSPERLARDLARPEQSARRLLAAAGSGVRSAVGHGLYGYLVGALVVFLVGFAATAVVQVAGAIAGTGWRLEFTDQGWNSLLLGATIAIALYHAARGMVTAVSITSRRLAVDVRPWVAAAATAVAFVALVLLIETPHNVASVVGFMLAPFAVVLGAYRPALLPTRIRPWYAVIALIGLAALILSMGAAGSGLHEASESGATPGLPDRGLSHIGPRWGTDADGPGVVVSNGWSSTGEAITWEAEIQSRTALAAFGDLRLEAWRTRPDTFDIDTSRAGPFAVAPVEVRDGNLHAEIVTTRDPHGGFWDLVLTGVGPDGVRHVLDAGSGGHSTFSGTAWEWILAVLD